jgi:hypothetical protein
MSELYLEIQSLLETDQCPVAIGCFLNCSVEQVHNVLETLKNAAHS